MERLDSRGTLPSIGATIADRYRIVGAIERPGATELFAGFDTELHRPVALKVLSLDDDEGSAEESRPARLAREARRLASMQHPNIAQLLDHGEDAGRYYLVQEYVEGPRLSEILRAKGPLRLADFVPIAVDVLRAVGFANAHGVMVRDVGLDAFALHQTVEGPSIAKLLDLRLARLEDDSDRITRHGIVGTATYLAPEQVVGAAQDVRIDVYAIGVLFYQLLSGRTPHDADNLAALLYKKVHERPRPLREVLPVDHDVPDDVSALVDECMAIAADDRPPTADFVLERVIDAVPSSLLRLSPRRNKAPPQGPLKVRARPMTRVNGPTAPYPELAMEPLDDELPIAWRTDEAVPRERHDIGETIPDGALHLAPAQQVTLATAVVPRLQGAKRRWLVAACGVAAALAIVAAAALLDIADPLEPSAPIVVEPPTRFIEPAPTTTVPPMPVVEAPVPVEAPILVEPPRPAPRKDESPPRSRAKKAASPQPEAAPPPPPPSEPPPSDDFGKLRRKGLKAFD